MNHGSLDIEGYSNAGPPINVTFSAETIYALSNLNRSFLSFLTSSGAAASANLPVC